MYSYPFVFGASTKLIEWLLKFSSCSLKIKLNGSANPFPVSVVFPASVAEKGARDGFNLLEEYEVRLRERFPENLMGILL